MHNATKRFRTGACVAFFWLLSGSFLPAQVTESARSGSLVGRTTPSSRESEYQRWIPLDPSRGPSQNPLELLARLQKGSRPKSDPFSWSQLQKAFQENPGLGEKLRNLSPAQREQLQQIAQSLSKQAFPNGPPPSLEDLPPALQQQIKNSPELQKLAQEIARSTDPRGPRSNESGLGAASEGTEMDVDQSLQDLFENKAGSSNDENVYRPSDAPDGTPRTSGGKGEPSRDQSSKGDGSRDRANDASQPSGAARSGDQANSGEPLNSTQGNAGQTASADLRGPTSSNEQEPGGSELERIQRRWDEIQRQRALHQQRMQQRQQALKQNAIQSSGGSEAEVAKGASSESSVDLIRRKLRELGLSSFLQQIAKEAVGVERQQLDPTEDKATLSKQSSNASLAPSDTSRSPIRAQRSEEGLSTKDDRSRWSEGIRRSGNASDSGTGWISSKDLSNAGGTRSTNRTSELDDAPEKSETSPFALPQFGDLPSLPVWFWTVPLSLGLLVLAMYLFPRSRVILDRITGRAAMEAGRADPRLGEIRGREDAVRAFHWILERKVRGFESWWTSRRVVEQMRHRQEPLQPQVSEAASLYELARYTPETYQLDSKDLERMRQAIRACASAEAIG